MKKRLISLLLAVILIATLFAACGSGVLSVNDAQKIALKEAGLSAKDASVHTHVVEQESGPCYSVHISSNSGEFEYIIDAVTGEVLSVSNSTGH